MPSQPVRIAALLLSFTVSFVYGDERHLMVRMRDGVELATTVFLPEQAGASPCVLSRTPYNRKGMKGTARQYLQRGYAFVAQDCRGRFESKGFYDPFKTDHLDGFDTVEWIAKQDWSDGKVGMLGGSALGITSHLAATQTPPHLECAYVIVASASARTQTVYMGGVYRKELNDGWLSLQGATAAIQESLAHPAGSAHWDWREIPDFHGKIRIPILEVGGWFDIFSQGAIDNFTGLQQRGAGLAAGNQRLVMGPWAHGPLGGGLKFPDDQAAENVAGDAQFRWFDRWLKDIRNGIDEEPAVRYYLIGDPQDKLAPGNEWRSAPSWPPAARPTSWFLRGKGKLQRAPPTATPASTSYTYDPRKPVPTVGGSNLLLGGKGPMDQRRIKDREDYLRFESPTLEAPLEVIGRVYVDLYVSSDAVDTDFTAKLVDVYPDGYEALILDSILRAKYREGLTQELLLKQDEIVSLRIDLWSTAIVFNQGHKIAVHISSSNDPRFEPNANTGRLPRVDDEKRSAVNTIHHDLRHPSRLLLPVTRVYPRHEKPEASK